MKAFLRGFKSIFSWESDQEADCPRTMELGSHRRAPEPWAGYSLVQHGALLYDRSVVPSPDYPDHDVHSEVRSNGCRQESKQEDTAKPIFRTTGTPDRHQHTCATENLKETQKESARSSSNELDECDNILRGIIQSVEACYRPVDQQASATAAAPLEQGNEPPSTDSGKGPHYGEEAESSATSSINIAPKTNIPRGSRSNIQRTPTPQEELRTQGNMVTTEIKGNENSNATENLDTRQANPTRPLSVRRTPPRTAGENSTGDYAALSWEEEEEEEEEEEDSVTGARRRSPGSDSSERLDTLPSAALTFPRRQARGQRGAHARGRRPSLLAEVLRSGSSGAATEEESEGRTALLERQGAFSRAQERAMEKLAQEGHRTALYACLKPGGEAEADGPEGLPEESAYLWNNPFPEPGYGGRTLWR